MTVAARRVTHLYERDGERVAALRDIDLTVEAGEQVALLGPSGSGKSTLLRLLCGLELPTTGNIRLGDADAAALGAAGRRRLRAHDVGLLVQDPGRSLLPYATPTQALRLAGSTDPAAALAAVGLERVARQRSGSLSAGEQQRLALSVALAARPRLLLADEPTSRLNPALRDEVVGALAAAVGATGATLVVVTHDPAVAASFPRSLSLTEGRLGAEGRHGHSYAVVAPDGSLVLPAAGLVVLPPGSRVDVEVTADEVRLRRAGELP